MVTMDTNDLPADHIGCPVIAWANKEGVFIFGNIEMEITIPINVP